MKIVSHSSFLAQHFYNAILALPPVTKNNGYLNGTPDYQLIFHTADQAVAAAVDLKRNLVGLDGEYHSRGGVYRMNEQFQQMFRAASQKRFDILLFWSLDRLSREGVLPTLQYLNRLTSYGVAWPQPTAARARA